MSIVPMLARLFANSNNMGDGLLFSKYKHGKMVENFINLFHLSHHENILTIALINIIFITCILFQYKLFQILSSDFR